MRKMNQGSFEVDGRVVNCEVQFAHHKQKKSTTSGSWYFVTVYEGRNRIVRRLFEECDSCVIRLIRYGFGELRLPESLAPGQYRQLSTKELGYLRSQVGL